MNKLLSLVLICVACNSVPSPHETSLDAASAAEQYRVTFNDPVAPGQERLRCTDVAGPDHDLWIGGWNVTQQTVHHSGLSLRVSGIPSTTVGNCDPDQLAALLIPLFTVSQPTQAYHLPDGVGLLVPAGAVLSVNVHELNTNFEPATAIVTDELVEILPPARVAQPITLLGGGKTIAVPPGAVQTLNYSCIVPASMDVIMLEGHAHAHNTNLNAAVAGASVYAMGNWAEPKVQTFEALHLAKGDRLAWSCTVDNTTAATLHSCNERDKCEMCAIFGLAIAMAPWACSTEN